MATGAKIMKTGPRSDVSRERRVAPLLLSLLLSRP
jgi:hypothetical protein